MEANLGIPESAEPINQEVQDQIVEPFVQAVQAALSEMAGTEVMVQSVYRSRRHSRLGDIEVAIDLTSSEPRVLVLSFLHKTAANLAGQMLPENAAELDENLIRDCMGEIANVVAGQAKSLLAGTPHQFTFSLPQVLASSENLHQGLESLVITFLCDQGAFALRLIQ
jgi:chemotaxis protein CheX